MRFLPPSSILCFAAITHGWVTTAPLRVSRPTGIVRQSPLYASVINEYDDPVAFFPKNDTTGFSSTMSVEEAMPAPVFETPQAVMPTVSMQKRLALLKPMSWLPPTFAVMCGAAASGNLGMEDFLKVMAAMALAGPFWEGFAQTMDAWIYQDRKNKNMDDKDILAQVGVLVAGGMGLSLGLTAWSESSVIWQASLLCFVLNFLYAAPPADLAQKGWMGDMAARLPNMALPWIMGQAMLGGMEQPQDFLLPVVCSMAQLGPAILNDLAIPEHKKRGAPTVNNRPKWIVIGVQDGLQLAVAMCLASLGEHLGAAAVTGLVLPQMFTQRSLLFSNLLNNDTKAFLFSQPFIYMAYLATALSLGHYHSTMM